MQKTPLYYCYFYYNCVTNTSAVKQGFILREMPWPLFPKSAFLFSPVFCLPHTAGRFNYPSCSPLPDVPLPQGGYFLPLPPKTSAKPHEALSCIAIFINYVLLIQTVRPSPRPEGMAGLTGSSVRAWTSLTSRPFSRAFPEGGFHPILPVTRDLPNGSLSIRKRDHRLPREAGGEKPRRTAPSPPGARPHTGREFLFHAYC